MAPPPKSIQPIFVIKKKGGHAGHHGGAWKVAYADFVTALMALFIVLWLMNTSEAVKKAVAGYFNDPKGTGGLLGSQLNGTGQSTQPANLLGLEKLKQMLEQEIKARKDLEKLSKQIEINITPEGLRVELLEGKNGTFYQSGSPRLSDSGQELLALLATELKTLPNGLLIEGHTDATPYSADNSYGNWELSADRANSARRLMQEDGVRSDQVTQVRGYADQMLRNPANPTDPSNRRISILVKNFDGKLPANFGGAKVVDGGAKPAAPGEKPKESGSGPPAASPEAVAATAPAAAAPAQAAPKPSAATPAAKPSLMDRMKAMLPGGKK
jgi:chemotaxis protein MotB